MSIAHKAYACTSILPGTDAKAIRALQKRLGVFHFAHSFHDWSHENSASEIRTRPSHRIVMYPVKNSPAYLSSYLFLIPLLLCDPDRPQKLPPENR